METAMHESKKNIRNIFNALIFIFIFLVGIVAAWRMMLFFEDTKESARKNLEQQIASEVFYGVGNVATKAVTEVDCAGSKELVVTCKAIGSETQIIRFRSLSPLPDFRIHAVRQVVNPKIPMDIRVASGFPSYKDEVEIEKLLEVFRNPLNGSKIK